MSQIYDLKRGGVGSYNDVVKEQFVIFLEHLPISVLDAFALKLAETPVAQYANEGDILSRAHLILDYPPLHSKCAIESAIADIAAILCIKTRPRSNASVKEATAAIIREYLPVAVAGGFKDEDKFIEINFC